ncbi:hypothetical protein OG429_24560 [Streptomyces sp. NBC_00190]|uniref:hypothetical protein n=1 Tax=unclassified Streptomyces TaxID=2593676 RepID=UPI002E28F684|nr:hypothetical protein [Streptomyces sp. NBC_00190]WSZ42187.1 hypothetical protein OG239_27335 [Streptomyces sp. NBC_00868]
MPEPTTATLYCEPCPLCVFHAWQRIVDGRLLWEAEWKCDACGFGAPDVGPPQHWWGRAPEDVRAAVVAAEGTVLLRVDGSGGAALKVLRDSLGMTVPEVLAAVREGYRATPVEARYLTERLRAAGFSARVE